LPILGDGSLDDVEVFVGFLGRRRAEGQGLEEVVDRRAETLLADAGLFHQVVDRRQGTNHLAAIDDARGSWDCQAIRPVGHVAQDVLRHGEDLRRLRAVDRVEVGVVLQSVLAVGRQHGGSALDLAGVFPEPTYPPRDPIDAEVELQFAAVVGRNGIAMGAQAGLLRIECGLGVDQFVQPRDVFLRCDPPDPRRRRGRHQLDAFRQRLEEQVVVDEVALLRVKVSGEAALVRHFALQLLDDPVEKRSRSMTSGCSSSFGGISRRATCAQTDFQTAALVSSTGPRSERLSSASA
jgi:hypothetical protein